ncbi:MULTISPECIES: glycosyltransferase family 4 protein [unclassified Ensifer]|uniref:glycosyltransferase family 4 protein n=1 Tax=unclassified Ensifer TaxID=2633371 RepID=UPI00138F50F9|nr:MULTISPECIES: glycosyltransferase family 1 protein [unclassified Ensifer]
MPQRYHIEQASDSRLPSHQPAVDGYWNAPDVFDPPLDLVKAGWMQRVRNVMAVDAAHWTYPVPTRLEDAYNIYTLHDLVPLMMPEMTLDNKRAYFSMIKKITETADLIITVSEQSKIDIHTIFNIPDTRVINTYQDVNIPAEYLTKDDEQVSTELREAYGLECGQFILFYGAIEPKKNVGRLVEAFLSSRIQIPLIIAGKDGWLVKHELRAYMDHIENALNPPRIRRIPYVPRHNLFNLIRGARAVAFPSLYEGFGLPIAEAMLCGTPLLTSNCGAMREIAGSAAILVDPYSTESIRLGLEKLTYDSVLREEMGRAGRERSAMFNSDKYRSRLNSAYSSLC